MSDSTPERERAAQTQKRYWQATAKLREDRDLTEAARNRRLAETWTQTRREPNELQSTERERLTKREQELQRTLFSGSAANS